MAESVFLSPKSIAVIGASDKRGSVGATITSNIMNGFTGTVYPISPSRETVFYKKAYKTVLDVPKSIDLAVIVIKNTLVAPVLEEWERKKSKVSLSSQLVSKRLMKKVQNVNKKLKI